MSKISYTPANSEVKTVKKERVYARVTISDGQKPFPQQPDSTPLQGIDAKRIPADDLFSFFTASIIKEKVSFTR